VIDKIAGDETHRLDVAINWMEPMSTKGFGVSAMMILLELKCHRQKGWEYGLLESRLLVVYIPHARLYTG
jgi:hypothetical protein